MCLDVVSCHRKKVFEQRKDRLRRMIADWDRVGIATERSIRRA